MVYTDMFLNDIVVLDLETTGLDPFKAEILELGAVRLTKDLKFKKAISYRTNPTHIETADPVALKVNGYNAKEWEHALDGKDGLYRLLGFIQGATVFSFNSTFDYGIMLVNRHNYGITQYQMPRYFLDIMSLSWLYQRDKGGYITLKYSCEALGLRKEREVHRAVNGALAGTRVLKRLCQFNTGMRNASINEALRYGGIPSDGF